MRNLFLTILILLSLTVATAYLTREGNQIGKTQDSSDENIHFTTIKPKAEISLNPADISLQYGQTASASVRIIYQGEKPDFAQFEMGFDPEVIGNISIVPGSFFDSPEILLDSIDEINGRISFAIKSTNNQTTPDNNSDIININFRVLGRGADNTTIYFLPKTKISADDESVEITIPDGLNVYIENSLIKI